MEHTTSRIAAIAAYLANLPGSAKEKLRIRGRLLTATLMLPNDWPPALAGKAAELKASLCNGAKLEKTVKAMSDKEANACLEQLSKEMANLANEIERARGKRQRSRK